MCVMARTKKSPYAPTKTILLLVSPPVSGSCGTSHGGFRPGCLDDRWIGLIIANSPSCAEAGEHGPPRDAPADAFTDVPRSAGSFRCLVAGLSRVRQDDSSRKLVHARGSYGFGRLAGGFAQISIRSVLAEQRIKAVYAGIFPKSSGNQRC
jgi:hypothetical protein